MGSNRFLFKLILAVILILITALSLSFIWSIENKLFTRIFFIFLLIIEAVWLYHIVSKTNRDLQQFLISLEGDDLSLPTSKGKSDKIFTGLYESFDRIHQKFFKLRISKEQEYQLYQKILNQTGSGLILYNNNNKIILTNPAASSILGVEGFSNLRNLDQIISGSLEFYDSLPYDSSKSWSFVKSGQAIELLVHKTKLIINDEPHSLISLQNIRKQLTEKAFRSQKNIIRVLSHEINNTLTPITTLTDALIRNSQNDESMLANRDDLLEGLGIIKDRSNTILDFVKNYKELSQIPDPVFSWFNIQDLISDMISLNQSDFIKHNIQVVNSAKGQNHSFIKGDKKLIGQVFQNLLNNSIDALKDQGEGLIIFKLDIQKSGNLILSQRDNGAGIPESIKERLFTPFFTTKENGSGIGLSLSQEIMHLHDGEINICSGEKGGVEVSLLFKSSILRSEIEQ